MHSHKDILGEIQCLTSHGRGFTLRLQKPLWWGELFPGKGKDDFSRIPQQYPQLLLQGTVDAAKLSKITEKNSTRHKASIHFLLFRREREERKIKLTVPNFVSLIYSHFTDISLNKRRWIKAYFFLVFCTKYFLSHKNMSKVTLNYTEISPLQHPNTNEYFISSYFLLPFNEQLQAPESIPSQSCIAPEDVSILQRSP